MQWDVGCWVALGIQTCASWNNLTGTLYGEEIYGCPLRAVSLLRHGGLCHHGTSFYPMTSSGHVCPIFTMCGKIKREELALPLHHFVRHYLGLWIVKQHSSLTHTLIQEVLIRWVCFGIRIWQVRYNPQTSCEQLSWAVKGMCLRTAILLFLLICLESL